MRLPLEAELRAERKRLLRTLDSLPDDVFDEGPTLCTAWSPRDVLGHLIGVDHLVSYYRPWLRLAAVNDRQVRRVRHLPRHRLMAEAREWAERPAWSSRLATLVSLGDLSVHHQDIVRGVGLARDMPPSVPSFILWDGAMLSSYSNLRIFRYRVIATDGYPPLGAPGFLRPAEVLGTREALGMWLAGRDAVAGELRFTPAGPARGRDHETDRSADR
ncbi:maleylpyruvate isomerase N-terminal domain-containing protein [Streptomyces achromogenes]|uniref:maleylpyruvate isomerase N-terminal domain-containing protein n=1 Tax=Streptomyces achromogenes TaxID=67255 RepID=UPI003702D0CB